jgi:hypothetical protein
LAGSEERGRAMGKYLYFLPEEKREKALEIENKEIVDNLQDVATREQFLAKMVISREPQEGFEELQIQLRSGMLPELWYVKILEREAEREEMTVFKSKRAGEQRGRMLRTMIADEEKEIIREKVMKEELEKRRKWKEEVVKKTLGEK